MPDPTSGTGQVPPTSQSPDSNGQVPPVSQVSSHGDDNANGNGHTEPSTKLTPEQLEDLNKKLRAENAKARVDAKRLAELEAAEQQRADAALSEKERYDKKIAALQAEAAEKDVRYQERLIRAEVRSVARELGLKPELAVKLLDITELQFNEDGDPTNVAELLAKAVADYGLVVNPAPGAQTTQHPTQQQQQPAAPQIGATNAPRGAQSRSANGVFNRGDIPKLNDPAIWKRGS